MSEKHTPKCRKSLISIIVLATCLLLVAGNAAYAEPYLQLDAYPAEYIGESVVTTDLDFTLYALVNSLSSKFGGLGGSYYISAALTPQVLELPEGTELTDLGTISFDGLEIVELMQPGVPPGMPPAGTFPTYHYEHEFSLDPDMKTARYDSQLVDLDGPLPIDDGKLDFYYEDFDVDATGLTGVIDPDTGLHTPLLVIFDLYTKDIDGNVKYVAPFSHNVLSAPVPGAVLLGLLGLGVAGVKLRRFA